MWHNIVSNLASFVKAFTTTTACCALSMVGVTALWNCKRDNRWLGNCANTGASGNRDKRR
jgi:hypothetical protein